jgi:LPS-assembly protein
MAPRLWVYRPVAARSGGSESHLPHSGNHSMYRSQQDLHFHTTNPEGPLCYGFRLGPFSKKPNSLLSTIVLHCHENSSSNTCIYVFTVLSLLSLAPSAVAQNPAQPDQRVLVARPDAPPRGTYNIEGVTQEKEGSVRHLVGKAKIEGATMLMQADQIDYDEDTGDLHAMGNVYFHNFARNEQLWADKVDYNTDSETGKFYKVRGSGNTRIDARPGRLTTKEPFFFQGEWAERIEDHYILHNGFITNCKMPNPWWVLRGPRFDIFPGDHAIAHSSIFWVRAIPIFYAPYFYKSLEKEPRRSGFLFPNLGNAAARGLMFGVGYFWAINRSYDALYHVTEYTSRGEAHHLEFRGKPGTRTDFDAIIYGVDDRLGGPGPLPGNQQYSGYTITATGRADLGDGWKGVGNVQYISSFAFRQDWSESINEAVSSEAHSTGFVDKSWSNYTFDIAASRLENFQSPELTVANSAGATSTDTDAVIIRKLPEADFSGREQQIGNLPLWFSFDSSAGLLYRQETLFEQNGVGMFTPSPVGDFAIAEQYQTSQLTNRVNVAPALMSAFHFHGFDFVPRCAVQETYYSESQDLNPTVSQLFGEPIYQVIGTNLVRSSRACSLDLVFPSIARVFQKKSIFGDKLKHVIEPRATYKYVTGIGEDFNRFIRFDDTDIVSDTNELDLSLTNRIYSKRGDNVTEIFTWELFQARYFDPTFGGALIPGQRNVFLPAQELTPYAFILYPRSESPLISILHTNPVPRLGIEWRTDYDPVYKRLTNSTVAVDYRWSKYFLSIGDNLVHTNPILSRPEDQIHFRAGWGDITRRGFNAGVDAIYDVRNHTLNYVTIQGTYNTDCCGLSVQYRLSDFAGIYFPQYRISFSVANLGSFGTLRKQDRIF